MKITMTVLLKCVTFLLSINSFAQEISRNDTIEIQRWLHAAQKLSAELKRDSTLHKSALQMATRAVTASKAIKYHSGLIQSYMTAYRVRRAIMDDKATKKNSISEELDHLRLLEKELVLLLDKEGYYRWLEAVFTMLPKSYHDLPQQIYDHDIELFKSAILHFQREQAVREEAKTWYRLGYIHHINRKLDKAEEAYLKSISLSDANGINDTQGAYAILGNVYAFKGNYKLALKYELEALRKSEENKDTLELGNIHLYLGLIYEPLKDRAMALKHYQLSLNEFKKNPANHLSDLSHAAGNTAKMLIATDPQAAIKLVNVTIVEYPEIKNITPYSGLIMRLMQAYMAMGDVQKAQQYCNHLLTLNASKPSAANLSGAIRFLIDTKQYRNAEQHLSQFEEIARAMTAKKFISEAFYFRYQLDSARQNYRAALGHHLKHDSLRDELINENQAKEIAALQVQYDTEEKEKDILLLQQQSHIDKATIQRAKLVRNVAWLTGGFLTIILSLLFYQNRVRRKNNKRLEHLLLEKDWLLKEVHHRVKNNLQTVLSLLESQSRNLENKALQAIQEGQNRVFAMSLIHKKLYQSTDVISIQMEDYLRELVQYLRDSLVNTRQLRFRLDLDFVELDVSQAVPVGLIVNEAITNAVKYAFSQEKEDGEIALALKQNGSGRIELSISDNGIGLSRPEGTPAKSLGMKLMKGLTDDLEGTFSITSGPGVTILVTFTANIPLEKITIPSVQHTMQKA